MKGGVGVTSSFAFEKMDVYRVAVEAAHLVRDANFGSGRTHLRDQACRASESVVLNIAEGRMLAGSNQRKHYRIALGSAAEMVSVVDLVRAQEGPAIQDLYRRVGAILWKLCGPT